MFKKLVVNFFFKYEFVYINNVKKYYLEYFYKKNWKLNIFKV